MPRFPLIAGLLAAALGMACPSLAEEHPSPADPEVTGALGRGLPLADIQRENAAALMQEWAEDLAYAYLDAWSSENRVALRGLSGLYAPEVRFFGRPADRAKVEREKRLFASRWPIRRYEHRPGTMAIDCDVEARICHVRSIVDWRVRSPARHARAQGAATFELGVTFAGDQPAVAYEGGRVVRVGAAN